MSLRAVDLTLGYDDRVVVEHLDLELEPSCTTAVIGPNGCGKSTLLRAIGRLLAPRSGDVLLDDRPVASWPTKALARDQLRAVRSFALAGIRASAYDGDTPAADRPMIRRSANLVLTNPDMLHRGILPGHERWAAFLGRLAYVVVDEAHTLRGVFGSHVAAILRRLRRKDTGIPSTSAASTGQTSRRRSLSRNQGPAV